MKKADIQPANGKRPDRIAVNQKIIRIKDGQYWLDAAVDPSTNRFFHVRLFPMYSIPITKEFLAELTEKHDAGDTVFPIDDARELESALREQGFEYRIQIHGFRNSVERVFREVERRASSFSNCFSHVQPPTANSWLQAFAA